VRDRGHGHAIYTQNQLGTKTISDCIMTGGYGYTMHAYGSSRAYVDNYLVERNVCYDAGRFLVGGGRPSRNIRVLQNYLDGVTMQIGYSAPYNEDCQVRGNVIVGGTLEVKDYRQAVVEDNLVLRPDDARPTDPAVRTELLPNRYDPGRANLVVFNWAGKLAVEVAPEPFLKPGDSYRLLNPRDLFGPPVVAGTFDGKPIRVGMKCEFAAFVLLKSAAP
jgi:hypothetical protein